MPNANSDAAFPETRWSLVADAGDTGEDATVALEILCQCYWPPLYAFARRSGRSQADAEDLVQSFLQNVLAGGWLNRADADRGKLRTFLLTSFRRHAKDLDAKAKAQKRGGGQVVSLEATEAESWYQTEGESLADAESAFDRRWAQQLLTQTLARLRAQAEKRNKQADFEALRPYLTAEVDGETYNAIARELSTTPGAAKVALHRLRARFAETLRDEVEQTLTENESVDDELRYLIELL
ncbi:MAG: sigma-70 family RNA polymerase sigma factor [Verrucomicrobiota bacterium]